ncbi:DUF2809 domain-containing protein [Longimicrobium terrae]|uniref:DUF2809 domain-containing protein n=1 Tax=Longimicrobium terrae TaxID=1639882 RepID=A0A841H0L8_9BACT|nr:DUF2809 domain-containing protein [Longimicrobium terrae]MBB4637230.1 hypothetical protein [Longimicrobium terrae]MBB6071508.1 hypothetical protein [Longimicrobium terrae]NNC30069.1 DUF2809 domain-containing protein [Longimicrobium terrae]
MPDQRPRSRLLYLLLTLATISLGLAARQMRASLPSFINPYLGDVLWAAMVFFLIAALRPAASTRWIAIAAAAFSLTIELSQLYHAPWIDGIRHTRLGGLVLGFGFLWSDLVCYAAGILLAAAADRALATRRRRS